MEREDTLQAMVDGLGMQWQEKRSQSQFTLGKLIEALEVLDHPGRLIQGITEPGSYRGYYNDLAFEPTDETHPIEDALRIAKGCLGEKFGGYKGGDYYMTKNTPLWIASYGCCGERLMGLNTTGDIVTMITALEED